MPPGKSPHNFYFTLIERAFLDLVSHRFSSHITLVHNKMGNRSEISELRHF